VLAERARLPFREGGLKVWEIRNSRPDLFIWGSKDSEDLKDLIDLRISTEKRSSLDHLSKYTTNRPNINRS
jgi:hypothetical protein